MSNALDIGSMHYSSIINHFSFLNLLKEASFLSASAPATATGTARAAWAIASTAAFGRAKTAFDFAVFQLDGRSSQHHVESGGKFADLRTRKRQKIRHHRLSQFWIADTLQHVVAVIVLVAANMRLGGENAASVLA